MRESSPVGVVHSNRLLPSQDLGSMTHHTRLVKRRLSIEQEDVSVLEMSVDLLVDGVRSGRETLVVDG